MDTKKVGGVFPVAEPAGGLTTIVIDTIRKEIGFQNWEWQVVIVPYICKWVTKHIHGWNSAISIAMKEH